MVHKRIIVRKILRTCEVLLSCIHDKEPRKYPEPTNQISGCIGWKDGTCHNRFSS